MANLSGAEVTRRLEDLEGAIGKAVREHREWILSNGHKGRRGDLSAIDLTGQDLSNLNLSAAVLKHAVLRDANLSGTVLAMADLSTTDLRGASLAGADLRGLGPVPRLAGNSPSYIARQLYDMQSGHRAGLWMPLMAPVVAGLSASDVLAASLNCSGMDASSRSSQMPCS